MLSRLFRSLTRKTEGVGLSPMSRKALKINGRFRRNVAQDYRTSMTKDKPKNFIRNQAGLPKVVWG